MDFRYNGVFGPPGAVPELPSPSGSGWGSPNKRGSRSGLPNNWFDAAPQLDPTPTSPFEAYRPSTSSPGLSPPASTSSGPTTSASSSHFPAYQVPPHPYSTSAQPMYHLDQSYSNGLGAEIGMAPSPPPQFLPYGLGSMNGLSAMGNGPSMQNMNPYASNGLSAYPAPSLATLPGAQRNGVQAGLWRHPYSPAPTPDDDVIPTAIVIKNIPFSVPRETLLSVIESLGAPLPYAFNYHHDSGVFRGLAFANFRAPDEAASVVAALNGYDVQGRKLRVEYKKVLQPGEKDRIEREKALKRMKSIQFNDPNSQQARDSRSMPPPPVPPIHLAPSRASNTSPDYGSAAEYSPPHSATSTTSDTLPLTLDLNDPVALDIYSRVLVFKEDRMRDELAFSKSLAPMERRIVHLVAQKLGLTSLTKGEGMGKYVLVTREGVPRPPLSASLSNSSNYLSPYASGLGVHTEPSGNSGGALRIKKSMPDLRGFHGSAAGRDPARSLMSQRSSGNLRDSRDIGAAGGRRTNGANGSSYGSNTFNSLFGSSIGEIPPVPPIPAGLTVPNSAKSNGHSFGAHSPDGSEHATSPGIGSGPHGSQPLRNPRGPAGESRGFGAGSGAAAGTLRTSVSHGVMRGGSGFSAGGGGGHAFGRSSRVVDEDDVGEILALSAGMDALRTKDSLDL